MNSSTMKFSSEQQEKIYNNYQNTKLKLLKMNAAIWFNKMCKIKYLKPSYIHFKTNGKTPQDIKTTSQAIQYRITQEIKFLHKKKQNLNSQLHHIHLKCADYCNGMWQHIRDSTETKIKRKMDILYNKLKQKLNMLITHTTTTRKYTEKKHNTHTRVINLTNTTFNHEQVHTLSLGPSFAI
jgi:hypothetical protein